MEICLYLKKSDSVEHVQKVLLLVLFTDFQRRIKFSHCIWSIWLSWIFILIQFCHFTFENEMAIFQLMNENLTNSLCHFRKHKSVFLQILHQSSVPSNITSLYFFSWNIIYFDQKELIKLQIFEIFEFSDSRCLSSWVLEFKICQIPHVSFEMTSQFLPQFTSFFIVMINNSPV